MKLYHLATIIALFSFTAISAQNISENAIGLRLGDSDGFGAEISYQRALQEDTRVEVDLGWRYGKDVDGFRLVGLYQWVWTLNGNFNWYSGAGAGFASYSYDRVPFGASNRNSFVFLAGDIGIEYDFDIPLVLSLDFRPEFGLGNSRYDNNDLDFDIALGVRYQF